MKTELVVHFLKLDIESRSFELAPWVQRLFASNDLISRFPAQARQLRICLERADSAFALPIPAMTDGAFAETHLGLGPCYYAAGRFYSQNRGHLWHDMDFAFDTDTLRANLGGHYVQSPQSVLTYVLRPILKGFLMPFYRLASVHAAGLAAGERTLLLAGGPAAGKSTAAIQLMCAGYELLSDDRMFVTLDGDAACALSSLDFLHVTDATLRMFPTLRAHVVGERDESDKWAVAPPRRADDTAWRAPRRVTDFIQLRRGSVARPRLAKLERGLALQDLLRETMVVFRSRPFRSAPYPFAQYSDFILTVVAALVRDAHTYVLEFADHDLPRLPALLDAVRAG